MSRSASSYYKKNFFYTQITILKTFLTILIFYLEYIGAEIVEFFLIVYKTTKVILIVSFDYTKVNSSQTGQNTYVF